MLVAFDCQGVLIDDGDTPEVLETRTKGKLMPEFVRMMVDSGATVVCISAVPEASEAKGYEVLCKLLRGIPLHGIYPAFIPPGATLQQVGAAKAEVMKAIGAAVLFDDIPEVCEAVRAAGLLAIHYSTKWEREA